VATKNKTSIFLHDQTIARLDLDDVAVEKARWNNLSLKGAVITDVDLRNVKINDANIEGLTIDGVRVDLLLKKHGV